MANKNSIEEPRNYISRKNDWVKFQNGKPKVKLRKYISNIAKEISSFDNVDKSAFKIKLEIIKIYDSNLKSPIESINNYYLSAYESYLEHTSKDAKSLIETIEKII